MTVMGALLSAPFKKISKGREDFISDTPKPCSWNLIQLPENRPALQIVHSNYPDKSSVAGREDEGRAGLKREAHSLAPHFVLILRPQISVAMQIIKQCFATVILLQLCDMEKCRLQSVLLGFIPGSQCLSGLNWQRRLSCILLPPHGMCCKETSVVVRSNWAFLDLDKILVTLIFILWLVGLTLAK